MTHVWQRLVSKSMEEADHGHDFRKKVDEINKKSKNEWRVGYEELNPRLVSDEPIDERPEDFGDESMHESVNVTMIMTAELNQAVADALNELEAKEKIRNLGWIYHHHLFNYQFYVQFKI